ncbi:MAG: hypothetical protein SGARI_000627 [Bacillariaceae sp.]
MPPGHVNAVPIPMPPPMVPAASAYPITSSQSASSLPPALPPPAFDVSADAKYSSSMTESMSLSEMNGALPSTPQRKPSQYRPQFTDYLSGGLEMNLSIAIDFTASNGDPRQPGTLHHLHHDNQLNDYEKVLTAVGAILAKYDSDQSFPVLGFGAKYHGQIKHCFQVGGASELKGLSGVLKGYRSVFNSGLTMSEPTVFAEVIQHAAIQAQKEYERKKVMGKQSYSILLIVTDGSVRDEQQTKVALKYASSAPLSVVIVGVGNADFSKMTFLNNVHQSDDDMRDIVQFVEFNRFRNDRQALCAETLSEIPDQVVSYFYDTKNIHPMAANDASFSNIVADDYDSDDDLDLDYTFGDGGAIQLAADTRTMSNATWNGNAYGNALSYLTGSQAAATNGLTSSGVTLSPGRDKPRLTPYVSAPASAPRNFPIQQPRVDNDEDLIHVKVPANAKAGMQLRVENPRTKKTKIVVVPMGVPAVVVL